MDEKNIIVAAVAMITNDKKEVLLQKRADPEPAWAYGKWELPGGGVEFGESPEDTVVREVKEEIGCTVDIVRLIPHIQSKLIPGDVGAQRHILIICYECRLRGQQNPTPTDAEVSEIKWCTVDEARGLDTLEGTVDLLRYADI